MAVEKAAKETRRNLFVGGLHEDVDETVLRAGFIAFGDVEDVNVPLEMTGGSTAAGKGPVRKRNRGFGFVTYELAEDASAAIANMNDSEIYGKRIRVNYARAVQSGGAGKAVWADSDKWGKDNMEASDAAALGAEQAAGAVENDGLQPTAMRE